MNHTRFALLALIAFSIIACTAGPNPMVGKTVEVVREAGFLKGLWHGFIVLFTFIISLFSDKVSIYEVHNNGNWYNFGFVLGAMMFWSGGTTAGPCGAWKKGEGPLSEVKAEIKAEIEKEVSKEIRKEFEKEYSESIDPGTGNDSEEESKSE